MGSKGREVCRLCAGRLEEGGGVRIFAKKEGEQATGGRSRRRRRTHHHQPISDSIRRYLRLEVREGDDLPQRACPRCCSVLDDFHKFAQECLRAQDKIISQQVSLRIRAVQHLDDTEEEEGISMESNLKSEWEEVSNSTDVTSAFASDPEGTSTRRRSRKQSKPIRTMVENPQSKRGKAKAPRGAVKQNAEKQLPSPPTPLSPLSELDSTSQSDRESDPDYEETGEGVDEEEEDEVDDEEEGEEEEEEEEEEEDGVDFRLECHTCGEELHTWQDLVLHCKQSHSEMAQCKCVCGEVLTKKKQVKRHRLKHLNSTKFSCKECGKLFCEKSRLEVHKGTHVPKDERPFRCSQCPKRFHTEVLVKQHEKTHVPLEMRAIWQCDICNKKLCTKNSLDTHLKNIHMGERSYVCDICGRTFTQKGILKDHLVTHSDDTPFSCDKCGKRFKTKPRLKIHSEVHREDPLVCPVCGMLLATSRTLKIHMATHSNDRPYRCMYCGKGFKRSKDLKGHYNYHEGKKPYQCRYCGRCFTNSGNCRSHKRRMHVEELHREGRPPTTKKQKGMPTEQPPPDVGSSNVSCSAVVGHDIQRFQPLESCQNVGSEGGGPGVMEVMSGHAAAVMFPHMSYMPGFQA